MGLSLSLSNMGKIFILFDGFRLFKAMKEYLPISLIIFYFYTKFSFLGLEPASGPI